MAREESMDDAINRQTVLSKIKEVCFSEEWAQFRVDNGSNGQRDFIINYIEQLSSVAPKQKWISVSERLPDDRKTCLVTFKDGYVDTMCYAPDLYRVDEYDFYAKKGKAGWYDYDSEWGFYSRDDVVAWMPLPEPYKTESEDAE